MVGVKDCLYNAGTITGNPDPWSVWKYSKRHSWCNSGFRSAFNSYLRSTFKQFKCITGRYNNSKTGGDNYITQEWFTFAAAKEVFNQSGYSTDNETNALRQFSWYSLTDNWYKNNAPWPNTWWLRSPSYQTREGEYSIVSNRGAGEGNGYDPIRGISPFGVM